MRRTMGPLAGAGILLWAGMAAAQTVSYSFEPPAYTGSATGTVLTGQDGWLVPAATGGVDHNVFTYAGNTPGFAANPTGGAQFIVGQSIGPATAQNSRAEHAATFTNAGGAGLKGAITVSWDVAAMYTGTLPAANNLGSFSTQPSATSRFFQSLYNWTDNNTATTWNCAFLPFNATSVQVAAPGILPDPAFGGLAANTWYRVGVLFSFDTNRIHRTSITNLSTGATTSVTDPTNPTGGSLYYLRGGATPAATVGFPNAVRFFAGGSAGQTVGGDNLTIRVCYPDCNYDGSLTVADFGCFQTRFVGQDTYSDCNGDGVLTVADFGCFQTQFVNGCP